MLLKGSCTQVVSRFRVQCGLYCASHFCRIPPWSLKLKSSLPALVYAAKRNYSYIVNVKHLYQIMHSKSPHPDTTPVVRNVWCLDNRQYQQKHLPSGDSQLLAIERLVSIPAGESDSSQGVSSSASRFQGQNSTASSYLNNSRVADIIQCVTSTWSTAQRLSNITTTPKPGTGNRSTPAPWVTSEPDSTRCIVSWPSSGIASTPSLLSGLEYMPTPIPNPDASAMITDPPRMWASEKNQRQRRGQLQLQAVSAPWLLVSSSHSIHRFGHWEMMCIVFATGRLLNLYLWHRQPFMSASNLEMVCYTMRHVAASLAEAPHWQIIETYWITAMQQNNTWPIPFRVCTKEIFKEVRWSIGLHSIL